MRDSLFNALDGMEMGKSEHDWLEQRFGSMTAKERLLFQGAMQLEHPQTVEETLRVLSYGSEMLSAPLSAFVPFLLGIKMLLDTVRSVDSMCSKSRMGHGLGQAETVSSKKPHTGWD